VALFGKISSRILAVKFTVVRLIYVRALLQPAITELPSADCRIDRVHRANGRAMKSIRGRFMTRQSILAIPVVAICLSGFTNALAQEVGDSRGAADIDIEEIVVTASRREQALQDAPVSVTAINPDDFSIGGLTTLQDIVSYTPGTYLQDGGSPARQTITMRGVSQTLSAPTVGVYLDDIPLGSGGHWAEANLQMQDLVRNNLERIELIKGPQGTLYGASSMGGVIRYITKDPSTQDIGGAVSFDISDTREGDLNYLTRGSISWPLIENRLGVSISGFFDNDGGFIDRSEASVDGAATNVNESDVYGGTAKVVAHFTDDFTGTLTYARSDTEYAGTNSINLTGPPFEPVEGDFLSLQGAQDNSTSTEVLGATLEYDFRWATLLSSTSYQEVGFDPASDLVVSLGPLVELLAGTGAGSVTSVPFVQSLSTERFVQELRLTSEPSDKVEWIVGGYYSNEDSSNKQTITGQPVDFTILDIDLPSEVRESAVFGDFTYYITPDFDLTVGARVAYVETGVELTDGPEIITTSLPLVTDDATVDTYLFSARYRPSEDVSLYARIASGYRPSSANLPILDQSGDPVVDPIIETDTLWSYEAGAKGKLYNGAIAYDLAAWYLKWKDLQAPVFIQGISTGGNANSNVTAFGVEGTVLLTPTPDWTVNANFAYANSELDDDETAAFGALAGENMTNIPEWSWSLNTNYDFSISADWDGFVGGGLRYVGDRDSGFEGGTGKDGSEITPLIANIPLDHYLAADFRTGVTVGSVTASLYVNNLFDEYGLTSGSARPVVQGFAATASVLRPRTIGAVISLRF
jgi:outer membrane receptor protein involved in Fe transport